MRIAVVAFMALGLAACANEPRYIVQTGSSAHLDRVGDDLYSCRVAIIRERQKYSFLFLPFGAIGGAVGAAAGNAGKEKTVEQETDECMAQKGYVREAK